MTAFVLTYYSTWIALAGSIGLVLPSGGSVSFLYGFIFCVLCNFALGASLGEMAAVWPTAGGQYHFVYALCTDYWKKSMVRYFLQRSLPQSPCAKFDTELLGWLGQYRGVAHARDYRGLLCV